MGQRLPPGRLFDEFRKALCEERASEVLTALAESGLLEQISPRFIVEDESKPAADWQERFCRLLRGEAGDSFERIVAGFELQRPQREALISKWKELH